MTPKPHTSRPRRRLAGFVAAAAALMLSVTLAPAPASAGHSGGGSKAAAHKSRTVDVMTRNLYLGADLFPVIGALATNPALVPQAASATWAAVQATKPEERMAAIAGEIARTRPAVVGLQEVTTWTTYSASGATTEYDFLELLLKALADRGIVYHEVEGATADNFASPPIPLAEGGAVSLADRDVIIKRAGVKTRNAQNGTFQNIISFPLADGSTLPVARGWGSVDVSTKKAKFRFVNSHLEAFGIPGVDAEQLRYAQVGELLAAQRQIAKTYGKLPMVYVGDYNSAAPTGIAYQRLVAAVGKDAWLATNRRDPGFTCCYDAAVSDPAAQLTSRIDLVVVSKKIKVVRTWRVGVGTSAMTKSGLWPSDHAGVVARLIIQKRHHHRR
jgi:endonuclease/exonuclease/phosphatase family metal-dependent hydrolase